MKSPELNGSGFFVLANGEHAKGIDSPTSIFDLATQIDLGVGTNV
jgi:hypothetical protein